MLLHALFTPRTRSSQHLAVCHGCVLRATLTKAPPLYILYKAHREVEVCYEARGSASLAPE